MIISELYSAISESINRGTSYDSALPLWTRRAVRWLERNNSFKYMERYVSFTLDPASASPRVIAMPALLKSFNFMRLVDDDGTYHPIVQVDPQDVTAISTNEDPKGFWLDGVEYLWLDAIPAEERSGEMSYVQYTTWPSDTAEEPTILKLADDLVHAQTIMTMAPLLRDADLLQVMKAVRDEALKSFLDSDYELRNSNRSEAMVMR